MNAIPVDSRQIVPKKRGTGRVALVSGGLRGVGKGIVKEFLSEGFAIVTVSRGRGADISDPVLVQAMAQGRLVAHTGDIRNGGDTQAAAEKCIDVFGGIDVVVNNAALRICKNIFEISNDEWVRCVETNINGTFNLVKSCLSGLLESKDPWIINIGSTAGKTAFEGGVAYNTTKAAMHAFSETLMLELRRKGIRVCNIIPGNVWNRDSERPADEAWMLSPEDIGKSVLSVLKTAPGILPASLEIRPVSIPETPERGIRMLRFM
jgi:NAD(P)-dependent dehydrogenase (short-subunit alcohol dehydrogenase family)